MNLDLLRNYVHRMFLSKSKFAGFMKESMGLALPKSFSYKAMLERAEKQVGFVNLLESLSLENETEALEKIELIELLVCLEYDHLQELGNRLGVSVNMEMNRGDLTRTILIHAKLSRLMSVLKDLANEKFIVVVNYEGRIIGPLGVTLLSREAHMGAASALVQVLRGLQSPLLRKIASKAKSSGATPVETTQLILSKPGPTRAFQIMSNMILSKKIRKGMFEGIIPSNVRVDERYGIQYTDKAPIEKLSEFLCSEFSKQDLRPYISPEYGPYTDMVLAYCIQNNPFDIVDTLTGAPQLRLCLIKTFGIEKSYLPSDKKELINTILFHMGFLIPEPPKGLFSYASALAVLSRTLKRAKENETIVGSAATAFVETEKILKDIIFFYGAHLYHEEFDELQKRKWQIGDIEKEIIRICYGREKRMAPIGKTSFGKLVEILRLMQEHIDKTPRLAEKIQKFFGRKTILDPEKNISSLLDQISEYRKFYVHDVDQQAPAEPETAVHVLDLMTKLAKTLADIYPIPILGTRVVMDCFGTTYLVAKDEQDKEYTVYSKEHFDLDILQHSYLIKATTSSIVLNPILVLKP